MSNYKGESVALKYLKRYLEILEREFETVVEPKERATAESDIKELRGIVDGGPRNLKNGYDDILRCYERVRKVADVACKERDIALQAHREVKDRAERLAYQLAQAQNKDQP